MLAEIHWDKFKSVRWNYSFNEMLYNEDSIMLWGIKKKKYRLMYDANTKTS